MSSSKTSASRTTTPNAELFTIRIRVSKVTSMNIEHIILITNFLGSVRKIVDLSVYLEQTYSLAIYPALRLLFCGSLDHKIEF